MAKIIFVLKEYKVEDKIIVCDVTESGKTHRNVLKEGMNVKEFKKFVRGKYPDAEIINRIVKNQVGKIDPDSPVVKQEASDREIKQLMRNDWED